MYLYVFLYQMVQKFLLGQFVLGSLTPHSTAGLLATQQIQFKRLACRYVYTYVTTQSYLHLRYIRQIL